MAETLFSGTRLTPAQSCEYWLLAGTKIPDSVMWNVSLLCPQTASHARQAKKDGTWTQDLACFAKPGPCLYHRDGDKGASFCIRSSAKVRLSSRNGQFDVGHQCCYDKGGQFMRKTKYAGTADLAVVSILSPKSWSEHSEYDKEPYVWCCKESDNCEKYYEYRPVGHAVGDKRGK